ncbi:site-specific DNA-methyltransferase [Treponema phagedenis]|uniref:Site-specific DNA-methyltransferase n=1 Tax=Treponema phagedenis TaxID=162 RepID=A0AAE6IV25_TREPH|nr:DNA methyltransferase [Treponema phagedenis]NVP23600.1 site-specific DNA-methyltransferase [Treponema phagedenis]QEJ98733.1 site-specific DNA-methyltransferase [Treponema phagedenis]QEK04238.1 site-specific DNA-methyltransferase [Treponema phagedenis]QEK09853.1 site-specific DNA-methyltransferase [Treponema phagedenis]QLC58431.1 site-specific DNA-methyltransferase [Treponema phagedenis]
MAIIDELIQQITNNELRDRIQAEVDKLTQQKKFGLVFENHLPECTPLYEVPVKVDGTVSLKNGSIDELYIVKDVQEEQVLCVSKVDGQEKVFALQDLVTTAEFGEPIYPYLQYVDSFSNAPDSDLWHTLIEADNYHALQLLEYLYAGKVDCIYIDPPYNTGARDWKYNNDYVDSSDSYRHSKWLSMMEKRLRLAKKLLNPKDSVLICTIDEKEYLHLGCLLEELFPEARMQMVSSVINKKGSSRVGSFSRKDEYIYFLFLGDATISAQADDMISAVEQTKTRKKNVWNNLMRGGAGNSQREHRPNMFYPLWVDKRTNKIVSIGKPIPLGTDRSEIKSDNDNVVPTWPIKDDMSEGRWNVSADTLSKLLEQGLVKLGRYNDRKKTWAVNYLKRGQINDLNSGLIEDKGIDKNGDRLLEYKDDLGNEAVSIPGTIWVRDSHDASIYGTKLLSGILRNRVFSFPKSLYAVRDTIRFFVANKPNALIIDFFAGSGTTLHAVNLLNAEDGGKRRCIMVTNNEVSDSEAKSLIKQGYQPGDEEWERLGIARYVTWPRTVCSIKGENIKGESIQGNYLDSDLPMADGFKSNAIYFKLGFLDKTSVALGRQFKELLSVLWMKAGAIGPCPQIEGEIIPEMLILPTNHFAVLTDESAFPEFLEQMEKTSNIETVFIVTDSEAGYREMAAKLQVKTSYQLYRDYLDNFRINTGRK